MPLTHAPYALYMYSNLLLHQSSHPLGVVPLRGPMFPNKSTHHFMDQCNGLIFVLMNHRVLSHWRVPLWHALALCVSLNPPMWLLMGVPMGSSNLSSVPMLPRAGGSTPWAYIELAMFFPKHNSYCHPLSQRKRGMCFLGSTTQHRAPKFLLFTPIIPCFPNPLHIPCALCLTHLQIFPRSIYTQWVSLNALHPPQPKVFVFSKTSWKIWRIVGSQFTFFIVL